MSLFLRAISILLGWYILVRVICQFIHRPIPAFAARFIDNPVRRWLQPPRQVVGWMGLQDGMRVLEIGPGPGTFTIEAAKRVGERGRLFAIDIQPSVVSRLRGRLRKDRITNVVAEVASAHELPFSNNTFDRAFMVAVLGEIPDKKKALLEARRILKDDGLLAIGELLPDPDYPRRKTVIRWCEDAGFQLVSQKGGVMHYVLTFRKSASTRPKL